MKFGKVKSQRLSEFEGLMSHLNAKCSWAVGLSSMTTLDLMRDLMPALASARRAISRADAALAAAGDAEWSLDFAATIAAIDAPVAAAQSALSNMYTADGWLEMAKLDSAGDVVWKPLAAGQKAALDAKLNDILTALD